MFAHNLRTLRESLFTLVGGGGVFVHTAELDLSGLVLDDVLLLAVEAYAGAPGVAGVYRPRYAAVYLESRA